MRKIILSLLFSALILAGGCTKADDNLDKNGIDTGELPIIELEDALQEDEATWSDFAVVATSENLDKELLQQFFDGALEVAELMPNSFFTVNFKGELDVEKLSIKFSDVTDSDLTTLHIYDTDLYGTRSYQNLYLDVVKNNELSFEKDELKSAFITVKLSCETDKIYSMTNFSVVGIPTFPSYFLEEAEIALSGDDEKNPLRVWRQPISENVFLLSNELLGTDENLTDHEKVVLYMNYIGDFKVGSTDAQVSNDIINNIGSCGNFCNILAALLVEQGIESRIITLANHPENYGHVVLEVKINDKWSVYDPTYGAYYTTTPENTKDPYVLSYEELKSGRGDEEDVTQVVNTPERLTSEAAYDFLGPYIYEVANPAGVIGAENKLYYPLELNLLTDATLTRDEFTTAYQGVSYIGAASTNNSHIWTIGALEANGNYKMSIKGLFVGGELSAADFLAYIEESSNVEILSGEEYSFNYPDGDLLWEINFTAKSDMVHLTLSHDYVGPEFHYISIEEISIEKVS